MSSRPTDLPDEQLDEGDIQSLMENPSPANRAGIACKVARRFENVAITDRERKLAEDILGVLVHDAATLVREALSQSLAQIADVPHGIVLSLARDIDEVALPILEESPVLSEEDLIDIIVKGSDSKQVAIAGRPVVPPAVSNALVRTDNTRVVARLVANEGALIEDATLEHVADRFGDLEEVAEPLIKRKTLPAAVVSRLVCIVSERLQDYLVDHHRISDDTALMLAQESQERATIRMLEEVSSEDLPHLVQELSGNKRLTHTLLLRAACMGEMRFLEISLAHLTGLEVTKTWRLVHDKGPLGLRAVISRAGIPEVLYPAFRHALDVYHEIDYSNAEYDRERFAKRMLERLLTQYRDVDGQDLDFLIWRLGQLTQAVHGSDGTENAA